MLTHNTEPDSAALRGILTLADELRRRYGEAYTSALAEVQTATASWGQPVGATPFDLAYAADALACRCIRAILPEAIARYLSRATLDAWVDPEDLTVIDSIWLHQHGMVAVDWCDAHEVGDPEGLAVREVTER